jgi:uncharacterized membrane protein
MSSPTVMSVKVVSARLLWSIIALIVALAAIYTVYEVVAKDEQFRSLPVVLVFGAIGAFVSLQRNLKNLSEEDLQLMRDSWPYTCLAPLAGAVLAGILYLLFISGLLKGTLFPEIDTNAANVQAVVGVRKLFEVELVGAADYAKLFFWSFVAGFSERFVTNIIGRFEVSGDADHHLEDANG